jgi:hypothetical protein
MRRLLLGLLVALAIPAAALAQVHFQGAVRPPGTHTVRPSNLYLSADGTLFVGNVRWTAWGGQVAKGYGRAEFHGCSPSCAAAPDHHARALVRLSDIKRCQHRSWYSRVTVITRRASGNWRPLKTTNTDWAPC